MTTAHQDQATSTWWLWAVAPLLTLAAAYLSTFVIDAVMHVGPFDRAWLGWMITVPLIVVSPWLAAQAADRADENSTRWVAVLGPALVVAVALTLMLVLQAEYVGCRKITSALEALPNGLLVGIAGGVAFAFAAGITLLLPRGRPIVALLLSVVGGVIGLFCVILAFAVAFPGLSCAMPN